MDSLGRFYTQDLFSTLLINNIKRKAPKTVLELGVGGGALIKAAYERWQHAEFYGTDIDSKSIKRITTEMPFVKIQKVNGLSNNISKKLNINVGSIDIAVCNPPYLKIQNEKHYESLFEESMLSSCNNLQRLTSDIIFLAQNIALLKNRGELGIILPDSLITGHEFRLLRESLFENHRINSIIQLPDKVFPKTEARTHIILLQKGLSSPDQVPIYKASIDGTCNNFIQVNSNEAAVRMDFDHHSWKQNNTDTKKFYTLSDLKVEIKRGTDSYHDLRNLHKVHFHTTHFKNSPNHKLVLSSLTKRKNTQSLIAKEGDILLARVGKRCIGKSLFVKSGEVPISDCVYRIRADKKYRSKIFKALLSDRGQQWLKTTAHGVCSQVVSKIDLEKFPVFGLIKD